MSLTDAEKAYFQIKEKIITVEMPPGSVIRESELMEELALGRTPIREALKQLRTENLVFVAPRRGMFVADISITDLNQIYELRLELEPFCARLAAERITRDQKREMGLLVEEAHRLDHEDVHTTVALDRRFHSLLAHSSGNKFLGREVEMFYNLSLRIWYMSLDRVQPKDLDVAAHTEILRAIEVGDSARAENRMRNHVECFHKRIRYYL
jgi:DNA-binding GntR family transcriptional regulator